MSEKYRSAVEEDVAAKLTDVTAARDALRSHMDESKDGGVRGLDQIRLYRWQGFLTLCILSSAIHYIFGALSPNSPSHAHLRLQATSQHLISVS